MEKLKVVVFQEGYARILINPSEEEMKLLEQSGLPVFVDPYVKALVHVSPEYWKVEDGKIVEMTPEEKEARNKDLQEDLRPLPRIVVKDGEGYISTNESPLVLERRVEVPTEIIRETRIEVPVEVIRTVEVIKKVDVERLVQVTVDKVPLWLWVLLALLATSNVILAVL
jgi:hypothetical protein